MDDGIIMWMMGGEDEKKEGEGICRRGEEKKGDEKRGEGINKEGRNERREEERK